MGAVGRQTDVQSEPLQEGRMRITEERSCNFLLEVVIGTVPFLGNKLVTSPVEGDGS